MSHSVRTTKIRAQRRLKFHRMQRAASWIAFLAALLAGCLLITEVLVGKQLFAQHSWALFLTLPGLFTGLCLYRRIPPHPPADAGNPPETDNTPHELLLRHLEQGIFGLNQQGCFTFANPSAENLLGYAASRLTGRQMHALIHHHRRNGEPYPIAESPIHATLCDGKTRKITGEIFFRADGQMLPVEYEVAAVINQGKIDGVVILFANAQEKQRAMYKLACWHEYYRHAEWGVAIGTPDKSTIEEVNPEFARMHGYSTEELRGRPVTELFPHALRDQLPDIIRKAHDLGHYRFETMHLHKDGHAFPVMIDITAVRNQRGEVAYRVVNVIDISEQKVREAKLQKSEATLRLMMEHLPVGVWLADASGKLIYGNAAAQAISGKNPDFPLEQHALYQGWHAETGQRIAQHEWALARAIDHGESSLNEVIDIECADGSRKTILNSALPMKNERGEPDGAILINQDVTRKRQIQSALRDREASLARAQAQAQLGSWQFDIQRDILKWSDECYRIFGRTPGEPVSDRLFLEWIHPDDRDAVERCWNAALQGEPYDVQHRLIVDGKEKWVRERAVLEFHADGSLWRGLGTCQDITETKTREMELIESRQLLRELSAHTERVREDERKKIAREIHDALGQSLAGLRMDAALMRIHYGRDNPQIEQHATAMTQSIDEIFELVHGIIAALRPFELDLGLKSALDWSLDILNKRFGIRVSLSIAEPLPAMSETYSTALFRIIQEALTNVTRHARASEVKVSVGNVSEGICIRIRDDGVGFDPNASANKKTFGLLGIKERVLMFDGNLVIKSQPGAGTELRVTIPLCREAK